MSTTTRLCSNPSCRSHVDVEQRPRPNDTTLYWCFKNGFRAELTNAQLAEFKPEARLNLCRPCRTTYEAMVQKMQQMASRIHGRHQPEQTDNHDYEI